MKKILKGRGQGKTLELIKMSAESGDAIVCLDKNEAQSIYSLAQHHDVEIQPPVTIDYILQVGILNTGVNGLLIDNVDRVISRISRLPINAITMTAEDDFRKLTISDDVLDKLGFSEYWDDNGDSGSRTLTFTNGESFRIIDSEQKDDEYDGNYPGGSYQSQSFIYRNDSNIKSNNLFFLHDMYECVRIFHPKCVAEFMYIASTVRMVSYLEEYIKVKGYVQ